VHCCWDSQEERSKKTVQHDRTCVLRMLTSLTRGTSSWPRRADHRCWCPSMLETQVAAFTCVHQLMTFQWVSMVDFNGTSVGTIRQYSAIHVGTHWKIQDMDWIGLSSVLRPANTVHYRLYGRRFLQVKRPNQQYQSTEGTNSTQTNQSSNIQ